MVVQLPVPRSTVEKIGEALARRYRAMLVLFVSSFLLFTTLKSLRRFWYDELFTYYIAKQPGLKGIWRALSMGADNHPILSAAFTQWALRIFGDSQVSARVPAMLGFLLLCVSLYFLVRRRLPAGFAVAAMAFPAITDAYQWGTEAKPYGLWFGFSALALLCWQRATDGHRRKLALAGLGLSLGAAFLSYCYAPLILVALGTGEAVRTWRRRRVDWPIWAALVVPLCTAVTYIPLLRSLSKGTAVQELPTWSSIAETYSSLLEPTIWILAGIFLACMLLRSKLESHADFPVHEVAAIVAITLFPFFAVAVAKIWAGFYWARHGYLCVIGVSILLASVLRISGRAAGGIAAAVLVLFFFGDNVLWLVHVFHPSREALATAFINDPYMPRGDLPPIPPGVPIVVSNGIEYFEFFHYAKPSIAPRLYFLTDKDAALKYNRIETSSVIYYNIKRWSGLPMNVEPYREFVAAHPHFYAYGPWTSREDWLLRKLSSDGAELILKTVYESPRYGQREMLVEVNIKQEGIR